MDFGQPIPVIIGVGDVKNRSQDVADAMEPMHLMMQAILNALEDATTALWASGKLRSSIDSLSVVATWTWPYLDLPGLLAERLGIQPKHKIYSEHGGNQPIRLLDEAARSILQGKSRVAIVTGGEALASRKGV
jgi:acetyl-CoA acetyltransferase